MNLGQDQEAGRTALPEGRVWVGAAVLRRDHSVGVMVDKRVYWNAQWLETQRLRDVCENQTSTDTPSNSPRLLTMLSRRNRSCEGLTSGHWGKVPARVTTETSKASAMEATVLLWVMGWPWAPRFTKKKNKTTFCPEWKVKKITKTAGQQLRPSKVRNNSNVHNHSDLWIETVVGYQWMKRKSLHQKCCC